MVRQKQAGSRERSLVADPDPGGGRNTLASAPDWPMDGILPDVSLTPTEIWWTALTPARPLLNDLL
jgi:hypothetical protein